MFFFFVFKSSQNLKVKFFNNKKITLVFLYTRTRTHGAMCIQIGVGGGALDSQSIIIEHSTRTRLLAVRPPLLSQFGLSCGGPQRSIRNLCVWLCIYW